MTPAGYSASRHHSSMVGSQNAWKIKYEQFWLHFINMKPFACQQYKRINRLLFFFLFLLNKWILVTIPQFNPSIKIKTKQSYILWAVVFSTKPTLLLPLTMLEHALANVMNFGLNCRQVIGPVCFPSNKATFIPLSAFHTWIFPSSEPETGVQKCDKCSACLLWSHTVLTIVLISFKVDFSAKSNLISVLLVLSEISIEPTLLVMVLVFIRVPHNHHLEVCWL